MKTWKSEQNKLVTNRGDEKIREKIIKIEDRPQRREVKRTRLVCNVPVPPRLPPRLPVTPAPPTAAASLCSAPSPPRTCSCQAGPGGECGRGSGSSSQGSGSSSQGSPPPMPWALPLCVPRALPRPSGSWVPARPFSAPEALIPGEQPAWHQTVLPATQRGQRTCPVLLFALGFLVVGVLEETPGKKFLPRLNS